jgi:sugar phosphate isomerase/epimerase
MSFYLSSMVFNNNITRAVEICQRESFNLEFSSGIPYIHDLEDIFLKTNIKKIIHNYFPAPKHPFVLNLASKNEIIRNKSIEHCIKNIDLAALINSKYYSFHSGFCVDPEPKELGSYIQKDDKIEIDDYKSTFVDSLKRLAIYAKSKNVELLIENNVISQENFIKNGSQNFFLCTTSNEIIEILEEVNESSVSLLLDTAHLKVSANTLKNNLILETEKVLPYTKTIHHSDNNAIIDSNDELDEHYWFLAFKNDFKKWDHVIEVRNLNLKKIHYHFSLINYE